MLDCVLYLGKPYSLRKKDGKLLFKTDMFLYA